MCVGYFTYAYFAIISTFSVDARHVPNDVDKDDDVCVCVCVCDTLRWHVLLYTTDGVCHGL